MSASNPLIRNRLATLAGLFDFLDTGRFSAQVANVIKLGTTHASGTNHFDFVDDLRVKRENAFDAMAEGDLADGKSRSDAAVFLRDTHAFKNLNTFFIAFTDLDVHFD